MRQARVGTRVLTFETFGPSDGSPVFLLHGTPGSRQGPRPRGLELDLMGIRLIAYDRPGYGGSTRARGRTVSDAAEDVRAIADALGLDRFAVVGRSGGAPHALACAAGLPRRVTAAASLVGLAPRRAQDDGLDWFAGMGEANRRAFRAAWATVDNGRLPGLVDHLARHTETLIERHADFVRTEHDADMPDVDRHMLADAGVRHLLGQNFRVAAANEENLVVGGGDAASPLRVLAGWLDDVLAFAGDWSFKLDEIDVPVLVWHGGQDVLLPVTHSKWLAQRISGAELVIDGCAAHFGALNVLPEVLRWLIFHSAHAPGGR